MTATHRHLLTLLAAASLAACSSVPLDEAAPVETRTGTSVGAGGADGAAGSGANSNAAGANRVVPVDVGKTNATAMSNLPRTVFFDYDSYAVKDEYRPVIEANAKALVANPSLHMVAQGNTDGRGSSEYNLALGQRRAESVVRSLTLLGAKPSQLEAVSFGKERPAASGDSEDAYAQNRRVELARQ